MLAETHNIPNGIATSNTTPNAINVKDGRSVSAPVIINAATNTANAENAAALKYLCVTTLRMAITVLP